jgi:hypothetical protein
MRASVEWAGRAQLQFSQVGLSSSMVFAIAERGACSITRARLAGTPSCGQKTPTLRGIIERDEHSDPVFQTSYPRSLDASPIDIAGRAGARLSVRSLELKSRVKPAPAEPAAVCPELTPL